MEVGDIVVVLPPFAEFFPDTYTIEAVHENGVCVIAGDRDFDPVYLQKAE